MAIASGLFNQVFTVNSRRFLFWAILRQMQRLEGGGERTARNCERGASRGHRETKTIWQCFRKWGGPVREYRKLSELD